MFPLIDKLSIIRLPVPFAVKFIFPLLAFVVIVSLSISISSIIALPTFTSAQALVTVPKLYVLSIAE